MAETIHHALDDHKLAFKYVLRLLTVEQARQFETHFANCDHCAKYLGEITHFFELLRSSLGSSDVEKAGTLPTSSALPQTASQTPTSQAPMSQAIGQIFQSPPNLDSEKLVAIFANCFAGFQRLRKNIAARIGSKVEMEQIDHAAIEILLALPTQVSKIED